MTQNNDLTPEEQKIFQEGFRAGMVEGKIEKVDEHIKYLKGLIKKLGGTLDD